MAALCLLFTSQNDAMVAMLPWFPNTIFLSLEFLALACGSRWTDRHDQLDEMWVYIHHLVIFL